MSRKSPALPGSATIEASGSTLRRVGASWRSSSGSGRGCSSDARPGRRSRPVGRCACRALRRGRRDSLRADAGVRTRADAASRRGVIAPRGPADGARRFLAAAALRECRSESRDDCRGDGDRCPRRCCGGSSARC